MSFLHPEMLGLAPFVALPVLLHLLNRLRYRRVRWAAMEFLRRTERRAVRRARLRQILLMALRTLALAAALGALAQPVLRGGFARRLGAGARLAVLLDASAGMAAVGASGAQPADTAFARARALAVEAVRSLPRGTRVMAGAVTHRLDSPFREPVPDRDGAAAALESFQLTGGAGRIPDILQAAAERLGPSGGTLWLLTDLQASDWRVQDDGAWAAARAALHNAGRPRLLVTSAAPEVRNNRAVAAVRCSPPVLVPGDAPRVIAAITRFGEGPDTVTATLELDGRPLDSRVLSFDGPGRAEAIFNLPRLAAGVHAATVILDPDAMPGDDRFAFLLRTDIHAPVVVVDGEPAARPFESAADFLLQAIRPGPDARSAFQPRRAALSDLPSLPLDGVAAVVLAGVAALDPASAQRLTTWVEEGGLLIVFPGATLDLEAWNRLNLAGVRFQSLLEAPPDAPFPLGWISPAHPATAGLNDEGADQVLIRKLWRIEASERDAVLIATASGDPVLAQTHRGKGSAAVFAVTARDDFSNLPLTPPFLLCLHRLLQARLTETLDPPAREVFAELKFPAAAHGGPDGGVRLPDGATLPATPIETAPGWLRFDRTAQPGVYRRAPAHPADPGDLGEPLAALNVPAEESVIERIAPETVRGLLDGLQVEFMNPDPAGLAAPEPAATGGTSLGFALAALAVAAVAGEMVLAWSLSRPAKAFPVVEPARPAAS